MKRLVSKNRSTQLAKQLSSPRENRVEGVPVMHLHKRHVKGGSRGTAAKNALVPAHTGERVDGLLDTRLRLLPVKERLELLL